MSQNVEAVVDCFVLGDKARVVREWMEERLSVFVGIVGELLTGIGNGCKFSLVHGAEVRKVERYRVVIVGRNSISCLTAFFGFGSVCVAGYPIVRRFVDDVLELVSVYVWVVSWCCCVEVTLEIECWDC